MRSRKLRELLEEVQELSGTNKRNGQLNESRVVDKTTYFDITFNAKLDFFNAAIHRIKSKILDKRSSKVRLDVDAKNGILSFRIVYDGDDIHGRDLGLDLSIKEKGKHMIVSAYALSDVSGVKEFVATKDYRYYKDKFVTGDIVEVFLYYYEGAYYYAG